MYYAQLGKWRNKIIRKYIENIKTNQKVQTQYLPDMFTQNIFFHCNLLILSSLKSKK